VSWASGLGAEEHHLQLGSDWLVNSSPIVPFSIWYVK
jgi:hypothetical protein